MENNGVIDAPKRPNKIIVIAAAAIVVIVILVILITSLTAKKKPTIPPSSLNPAPTTSQTNYIDSVLKNKTIISHQTYKGVLIATSIGVYDGVTSKKAIILKRGSAIISMFPNPNTVFVKSSGIGKSATSKKFVYSDIKVGDPLKIYFAINNDGSLKLLSIILLYPEKK